MAKVFAKRRMTTAAMGRFGFVVAAASVWFGFSAIAAACPFCSAIEPSWSERREAAEIVALAEPSSDAAGRFELRQVWKGADRLAGRRTIDLPKEVAITRGLVLLSAAARPGADEGAAVEALDWRAVPVDEASLAYFARVPAERGGAAARLAFCGGYLEHHDSAVAEDAYREFGRADFDQVATAAAGVPSAKLRQWIDDSSVPDQRKGLYGMLLGLAADERETNLRFLRERVERPASDFRAGFDGLVGGYLLAGGEPALADLERLFLTNADSASGDVRHVMTALRFYAEYGRAIPHERIAAAMRSLVDREECAAAAIVDLARWSDWSVVDRVAALFERLDDRDPAIDRAVVGYLTHCPRAEAAAALERLRANHAKRVAAAEAHPLNAGPRQ